MKGCLALAVVIAAASITACATVEPQSSARSEDDKAYVTGSRIPARNSSGSSEVQSVQSKQGIDAMMRNPNLSAPPNPGGK